MQTMSTDIHRPFGKTGLTASPLGFGGAPIGFLDAQKETAAEILNLLLDHGCNVIDTAAVNHGSEELIGDTIGHRRAEYILVSKCGRAEDNMPGYAWSAELIEAQIIRSLRRLRTDTIDVIMLHTCSLQTLQSGEAMEAVLSAKQSGKVRFIGYSGDNEALTWASAQPEIDVVQASVNICDQMNIDSAVSQAEVQGTAVMAKRPMANACWKGDDQYERYRQYAQTYKDRFDTMNISLSALGFDGEPAEVWPEVSLRFSAFTPGVHVAIVGTTRPDRVARNIEAIAKGPLPEQAYKTIRDAFRFGNHNGSWVGKS